VSVADRLYCTLWAKSSLKDWCNVPARCSPVDDRNDAIINKFSNIVTVHGCTRFCR